MKRVLALFLVLICMLSIVACDKATSSEEPVIDGGVSDVSEIDINVSGETEQTQQTIAESISGTITRIDEDKIYDLTEEEVKIIADIIEKGTWNTEGTAECANDCKLIIDERTYEFNIDGFNGWIGSFKTFEVKDIDGEQFYRLYPISNDGGGVIFNDLKMDSSYDEDEENLDNILITIKFK